MKIQIISIGLCLLFAITPGLSEYRLQSGETVTLDPATGKVSATRDGITTPLQDGAHRLEDGSLLMVNRGISILPREPAAKVQTAEEQRQEQAAAWPGSPISGYSPCERLVQRVCGTGDQCRDADSCDLSRQLLDMESEERNASDNRYRMTYTSGQCQEVHRDKGLFPDCTR